MASTVRYDDIGTVNAVKLIPKIDAFNGYIKLYTELDSHIEVGDTVFITYSGNTADLGELDLDNLYYVSFRDENFYNNYAQGYNVLYVEKNNNSFVIDREIISIPIGSKLDGYYVSTVVGDSINIFDGIVDGSYLKNSIINPASYDDVKLKQAVVYGGEINNINFCHKYETGYVSLLLDYDSDNNTFIKYSNLNNSNYGYSFLHNVLDGNAINGCNIYCGNFFNCDIASVDTKFIRGGYFYSCYIDNYEIFDGYFHNTQQLENSCVWKNAKWDGGVFTLDNWTSGSFISGTFGNNNDAVWENGTFYDGVWEGRYWINGNFSGGQFKGQDSQLIGGQITYTEWLDGNFINGKMYNADFYSGVAISGSSFYVKNINVSGGELYSASINNGKITGGEFYDCSIKNTNICDGEFIANETNVDYQYNRLSSCNIYGGSFLGEWWTPTYDFNSAFTSSLYGLNEISDSIVYGGNFRFTHFHNNNEIKNGDFDNCLFFSPINIDNGKFYGKSDNNRIYLTGSTNVIKQRSTYFKSENVNLSKCKIRSKTVLNTSFMPYNIIYIEFDNGHSFSLNDAGKTVQLVGFNSQELWDAEYDIIETNTYYDPTSYSSGNYQYFEPIGENYIALQGLFRPWYYGDSGMVRKFDDFDKLSKPNSNYFNIYDGQFKNCYMGGVESYESIYESLSGANRYGNFNIWNGEFINCDMRNGMMWYNGIFDGGTFYSDYLDIECNWYNGNFYSGWFGNNRGGVLDDITLSIWYNGAQIIERSGATGPMEERNDEYRITSIYPLSYGSYNIAHDTNGSGGFIGQNDDFLRAFQPDINTFSGIVPSYSTDAGKDYMNLEVWSTDEEVPNNLRLSPYEFVFVVDCDTEEAKVKISKMLEILSDINITSDYYGAVMSPTNVGNTNDEPFKTFETLFGMQHRIKDYRVGSNRKVYILVEFDKIKNLFENSTPSELTEFYRNFRNVWSIANTGYYTYPMPVLYDSEHTSSISKDDLDYVGKFIIYGGDSISENSKWIYGTCPPPWWYVMPKQVIDDGLTTYHGTPYVNWNLAGVGTITKVSTKKPDNSVIQNNNSDVDFFEIESGNIYDRLLDKWILTDIFGVSDNAGSYSGDFKHPNGVVSSRDDNPIPFDRKLTEWYRKYIYLDKNKTGFKPDPKVRFEVVHNDKQLLYDPDFNFVEDYKTEPIWDLGGVQKGRIDNGFSHNRPAMIYNARSFNARLVGNVLYFDNSVDLEDYTKGYLKIKDGNGNWSWDRYLRITRRTQPTDPGGLGGIDNNLDAVSERSYENTDYDSQTTISKTTIDEKTVETKKTAIEKTDSEITRSITFAEEQGYDTSAFALNPNISLQVSQNTENFIEGVYKIIDISGYSYSNGYLSNCVHLEVDPNLFLDGYENVSIDVEVFTQGRGIILPYFYNMKVKSLASDWIKSRLAEDGIDYTEVSAAEITNYKDYGPRLSVVMEPIFHNYAFNGYQDDVSNRRLRYSRNYTNRDIFSVRLIKIVPSGNTYEQNPYYRVIFNNLYKNRNNKMIRYSSGVKESPIIGAYAFDSPDMPSFSEPSYFVDPYDILESLGYSSEENNWISILPNPVPSNNSLKYNHYLAGDMFTGTWKVANSGLTSENSFYGTYNEPDEDHINYNVDRVYFDIIDERLDINGAQTTNKIYPALRNTEDGTENLFIGGDTAEKYDIGAPNAALSTSNILTYSSSMNSTNYTRFCTDFDGELISGTSYKVAQIKTKLKDNSTTVNNISDLSSMTATSHTDFRLGDNIAPVGMTYTPDDKLPKSLIRFPDTETANGVKHGGIWFKMDNDSGIFERFRNDIDRHYLLTIKIIRRLVSDGTSSSVESSDTPTRPTNDNIVAVIVDDIKYEKSFGVDSNNNDSDFETLEFNIYHYLEAGDEWDSNTLVALILEHREYGNGWTREYFVSEFKWEYDPLHYIDLFGTIEPQVECAGKLVKFYNRNFESNQLREKTISTKILDYDWINKRYIFDVDGGEDFFNVNSDTFYLGTNMRITNIFNHENIENDSIYNNNLLFGYYGDDMWQLPPWNNTSINLANDPNKYEVIYQRDKVNDFTNKHCMMRMKYYAHSAYVEGSGEGEIDNYHKSLGDYPTNNPVRYKIIDDTGTIKNVQTSLINPSNFDNIGIEYYNYGAIGAYNIFVDELGEEIVGRYFLDGFGAFAIRQIDDETSERSTEAQATEQAYDLINDDNSSSIIAEQYSGVLQDYNIQVFDNGDYWYGPWTSSYGATVKNSNIEDSEHPAYNEGCFWLLTQTDKNTGSVLSTTKGYYKGNEPMLDSYSDDTYNYTYTYYQNGTFDGLGNVTDVYNQYPQYGGKNAPWNFSPMRGWKHISRWNSASLAGWNPGSYEGLGDRECEYVDFFMTRPTISSSLSTVNADDGVSIFINQPNVDLINGVDQRRRIVIRKVEIIEKINSEDFATEYPNYHVDSIDGMFKFGYEMYKQNNLFRIMSHNYDFSYAGYNPRNNIVWYYGDVDFSERHNFHDIALFNSYHIANIIDEEYQTTLFEDQGEWYSNSPNKMMYNMFYDMNVSSNTRASQYVPYFTNTIKDNFEEWNRYHQTSVQNFNLFSGIQLYTPNVNVDPATYQDNWYDGTFYDGTFKGEWWGGNWINGDWDGFNHSLEIDYESSAITYNFQSAFTITVLVPPNTINIGYVEKETYEINYDFLKKKKLYYEIAPWDEANKKATEVVKLPLRKKERNK